MFTNNWFRAGKGGLVLLSVAAVAIGGCMGGSDTDGGVAGDQDFSDTSFVGGDSNVGTLTLAINDQDLSVAETTGFRVEVKDSSGNPVANMEIACDTETGIALIEPSTGFEMTDGSGAISGVFGCELPGSYRVGCRTAVGGNKRTFETIRCAGPTPDGFDGFAGAGGGSLGVGGGQPTGDRPVEGNVRITSIEAFDSATGASSTSVDVIRGTCGAFDQNGDGDTTDTCDFAVEPFGDSYFEVKVKNDSFDTIFLNSFSYTIPSVDSFGAVTSRTLALSSSGEIKSEGEATFKGLFLNAGGITVANACSSLGIGEGKVFEGTTGARYVDPDIGFKTVTVRLFGTTSSGDDVTLTSQIGLSFDNFDNCGG